jgi:N-acyl homoserine lactone hydrolase
MPVDLFGDSSVTIIQAPGHTPGHQVVLVKRSGQQPISLAGDLCTSRSNYEHDRIRRFDTSRADTVDHLRLVRMQHQLSRQSKATTGSMW